MAFSIELVLKYEMVLTDQVLSGQNCCGWIGVLMAGG
jgi:hypothetical protein